MKIIKKIYNFSLKATKNYNSVSVTEGIEAEMENDGDDVIFEKMKSDLKKKIKEETKDELEKL